MTVQTEVEVDGITFDCGWYADYDECSCVMVSVSVNGQDLTGIISHEWWEKIEKELIKQLEEDKKESELDAALNYL